MAEGSNSTIMDLTHIFVWQKATIILYGISHIYLCGRRQQLYSNGSHTYICVAEGSNYTIRDLTQIFVWQKVEIIL